jgi:hypothetical protein
MPLWIFTTVDRESYSIFDLAYIPGREQTDLEGPQKFNALCLSIFVSEIMHSIVGSGPLQASPFFV